jgi:hypothetical protein
MMPLAAPARGFSALAPLHQNHRRNDQNRRAYETKWLQRKSKPMKHE